jgi:hypothetical protein
MKAGICRQQVFQGLDQADGTNEQSRCVLYTNGEVAGMQLQRNHAAGCKHMTPARITNQLM